MEHGESYCGIYCGACSILRHGETGARDSFIDCCPKLPEGKLSCCGCKLGNLYPACKGCPIRSCAITRGIGHCADCADYPCDSYKKWQSAKLLLPHLSEAPASLHTIKNDGTTSWLESQEKRWACTNCGAPFSWYAITCERCGQNVEAGAYRLPGLRKLICKIILPKAYKRAVKKLE